MITNNKENSPYPQNYPKFAKGSLSYIIDHLDFSKKDNMNSIHNILRIISKKNKNHSYFYFIERTIESLLKLPIENTQDDLLRTLFKSFINKIVFRADLSKETLKKFELLFTKHINKKNNSNFITSLETLITESKSDKIKKLLPEITNAIKNSKELKKNKLSGNFEFILNTELLEMDVVLSKSIIPQNDRLSFFPILIELYLKKDIKQEKFKKILTWLLSSDSYSAKLSFNFKN